MKNSLLKFVLNIGYYIFLSDEIVLLPERMANLGTT